MSTSQWQDEFFTSLRFRSSQTVERARSALNMFNASGIEINEQCMEVFFLHRCNTVLPSTAITDVAYLKSYLRFLVRRGYVDLNIDRATEHYSVVRPRTPLVSPKVDPDVKKLLTSLRPRKRSGRLWRQWLRDKAILSLLFYSGARRGEATLLTREMVADDVVKIIGKGNKERLLFIHPHTREQIQRYIEARTDQNDHLFVQHSRAGEGSTLSGVGIWGVVKRAAEAAGIDAHPHTLRHAFARNMLASNMNLNDLQDLMGHASPATTKMVYGRFDEAGLTAKVQQVWAKAVNG